MTLQGDNVEAPCVRTAYAMNKWDYGMQYKVEARSERSHEQDAYFSINFSFICQVTEAWVHDHYRVAFWQFFMQPLEFHWHFVI